MHPHYQTLACASVKSASTTIILIIANNFTINGPSPRRLLLSARVSHADLYKKRTNGNRRPARVPAQDPRGWTRAAKKPYLWKRSLMQILHPDCNPDHPANLIDCSLTRNTPLLKLNANLLRGTDKPTRPKP